MHRFSCLLAIGRDFAPRTKPILNFLVLLIALALSGGCTSSRDAPQVEPTAATLARLAAFNENLDAVDARISAALPAISEFSRSCLRDGTSHPLQAYFAALRNGKASAALLAIGELQESLSCFDNAYFASFADAFTDAALGFETESRATQDDLSVAFAPVALMLIDSQRIGPSLLHLEISEWFERHGPRIAREMSRPAAPFPRVGLIAKTGDTTMQIPVDKSMMLMDSLGKTASLMECSVSDLVTVEDEDGPHLVCPQACPGFEELLNAFAPEERAEIRAGFKEYSELCAELNSALDSTSRVMPGILACTREYVAGSDSGIACVANRLAAETRGPESLFERVRNIGESPSIDVVKNRQRCLVSNALTSEERRRYEELTRERREIVRDIERNKAAIARIEEDARQVRRGIGISGRLVQLPSGGTFIAGNPFTTTVSSGCNSSCQLVLADLDRQRQAHEDNIDKLVDELQDTAEEWGDLNDRYRSSTKRNCPPGVDNCDDTCGLGENVAEPLEECLFVETETIPRDDPNRQPDPRDPIDPDDQNIVSLMNCIADVLAEARPDITDCPTVPNCPDPNALVSADGSSDGGTRRDCSCVRFVPQEDPKNRRLCDWIATPDPGNPGGFTCPTLGESRDAAGSHGGLGGPDPEVFLEIQLGNDVIGELP